MNEQSTEDRAEDFQEQIAAMRTKTRYGGLEQVVIVVGILHMLAGVVLCLIGFFSAINASNALDQNEMIILSLLGVCLSLMGVAVFLRFSMGRFLRFWLLRQIYENRGKSEEG